MDPRNHGQRSRKKLCKLKIFLKKIYKKYNELNEKKKKKMKYRENSKNNKTVVDFPLH